MIRIGTPMSFGICGSSVARALGPPVETPMSTISGLVGETSRFMRPAIPSKFVPCGLEATGGGGVADGRRRMSRTASRWAKARRRGASSRRMVSRLSSALDASGLVMKSNAPFSKARRVRSPPRRVSALTTITATLSPPWRRASRTAKPSTSGISKSSVSKSGLSSRVF